MNPQKKTILILEDETPLLEVIKSKLETEGFRVVTARSVSQALEYLKNGIKIIEYISKRYAKILSVLKYFVVIIGYGLMIGMLFLIQYLMPLSASFIFKLSTGIL